ncbi:hypothetical protein DEO45_01790 [Rhodanobacter denitrificans]|uniref:Uncharacterized protein n=1 Tax=Rhodanobacter denitrificans TaxID=666685 RepID=A0A368KHP4_9GAMM|nr:hypothetical protein [Rhodanobacter denitrificans]RCS31431.1 hypothetical protein DEO45_01790 [Rhodanobacter denitrificans]
MPSLENIASQGPNKVGIWGFHGSITVQHVAAAVKQIAGQLNGAGHSIHIMSGTHGYCAGKVGAVATRDERFAQEDRRLVSPHTADNHPVTLVVHDFNNQVPTGPDPVTAVMAKLNQDIRALVPSGGAACNTFLLAYCCSAGTR